MPDRPSTIRGKVNFSLMLIGLLVLMLVGPVLTQYTLVSYPELVEAIFGGAFMLLVASLAKHMRAFKLGLVVAIFTWLCAIIVILFNLDIFRHLTRLASLVFCVLAIRYASQEVFSAGAVDLNKIFGAISIYLLLVVAWAIAYSFLELLTPGSFAGIAPEGGLSRFDEFVYFSMVTITTLGYGDITPENLVAGFLAGLEALVGVFYIAILMASLVSDFMAQRQLQDGE
jgi:voltage-gated potassium channel